MQTREEQRKTFQKYYHGTYERYLARQKKWRDAPKNKKVLAARRKLGPAPCNLKRRLSGGRGSLWCRRCLKGFIVELPKGNRLPDLCEDCRQTRIWQSKLDYERNNSSRTHGKPLKKKGKKRPPK